MNELDVLLEPMPLVMEHLDSLLHADMYTLAVKHLALAWTRPGFPAFVRNSYRLRVDTWEGALAECNIPYRKMKGFGAYSQMLEVL